MKAYQVILNHIFLTKKLSRLMESCKANFDSRYSIKGIYISPTEFASTDGIRLLVLTLDTKHFSRWPTDFSEIIKVPNVYKCIDGYLIGPMDSGFPKYHEIIPKDKKTQLVYSEPFISKKTFYNIIKSACPLDASLLMPVLEHFKKCDTENIELYLYNDKPEEQPIIIKGKTIFGDIIYLQMPAK